MWPKASLGAHLKHDLRILRPQCYHCNINLGGMGAAFYARMLAENGKKYMEALVKEKQITIQADVLWYQNKLEEYRKL